MSELSDEKLKVISMVRTSEKYPTQWTLECEDSNGFKYELYGRYRSRYFYVLVSSSTCDSFNELIKIAEQRKILFQSYYPDREEESYMSDEDFKDLTKHVLIFS